MNSLTSAPSHTDSLDSVGRAIFDWLMQSAQYESRTRKKHLETCSAEDEGPNKDWQHIIISDVLWQRSHCKLLAQVSLRYLDFFKEHFQWLVRNTKGLEKMQLEASLRLKLEPSDAEETPSEGSGSAVDPLDEKLELVTSHWVELALAGGRLKDVCSSFLSKEAQLSSVKSTLTETVWATLLRAIHSACTEK